MNIEGWYYLHENGDLIYKPESDGQAADIRDSTFARALWAVIPDDREGAWNILVEALAAGANRRRVLELAAKWHCTNSDAKVYAERVGCKLVQHDTLKWEALTIPEAAGKIGVGILAMDAMAELCKRLGYHPSKMWGSTFKGLLQAWTAKHSEKTP